MSGRGNDGNSSSGNNKGGGENSTCGALSHKPTLDTSRSFAGQVAQIERFNAEPDHTFVETSVKDVTDRGRAKAVLKLQETVEEAFKKDGKATKSICDGKALAIEDVDADVRVDFNEAAVRNDVKALCKRLSRLRLDGPSVNRDAAVSDILQQLDGLPITVGDLKSSKVAAELNQTCWRGNDVSDAVRVHAALLVRRWRMMYRTAEGRTDGASASTHARRCKNLASNLDEAIHSRKQKIGPYSDLIQETCRLLLQEPATARKMLEGGVSAPDFVAKAERVISRETRLKAHGLPLHGNTVTQMIGH